MIGFNQTSSRGGANAKSAPTPGRSSNGMHVRRNNNSRGSSGSSDKGKFLSAREVMKGVKSSKEKESVDSYPGLDTILKKARKMEKPFSSSDAEQRIRALNSLLPLNILPGGRIEFYERMEKDYVKAVSDWRADNWMLPVEKESEFPYSRTRNLVDPMVKYGAAWLPGKDWDSGSSYDSEGESIGFSQYMENLRRASLMETSDLRIKDPEFPSDDQTDPVLLKMKSENKDILSRFNNFRFNRREETWNTYRFQGYTILPRYRAFKVFSKQQQKLLEAYETTPNHETKKALLAHVEQHGQLIRDCPQPDPPAPKKKESVVVPKKVASVQVGSVMDSVEV